MNYTYIDKYGFRHAVESKATAIQFAKPSTPVFEYTGPINGGYITKEGKRARFPEDVFFGNENVLTDEVLTEEEVIQFLGDIVGYGK